MTDLSEILEATSSRDRAQRDSRTKDEFLALLAHELRTPLGAISNAVHVLELAHAKGAPAARAHEVISRQVGHISHLIEELLDVERVVSGKIRLARQSLDLAAAVRQAVATFTSDTQLDRHIEVTTEPVWVEWDAVRLDQVLTNLMKNAVKYTPPGGRIRVALREESGDAVLSVEDTGFGITPRLLPFIFDMYAQAARTLDRAQGGLGIGLTLVRRLVELHGGTVVASSEGEGRGSTFTVRLARIPERRHLPDRASPAERRAKARRVLLIEDSADARDMLRMMLELAGHVVYDAADGARGLELLETMRPDVGIIDIGLPRMDGYQVARRIRDLPHGRDMLLLALTGYGSPSRCARRRRTRVRPSPGQAGRPGSSRSPAQLGRAGRSGCAVWNSAGWVRPLRWCMAIQRTHLEEQQARLDTMLEEFRVARQRRLEKQGIALWNRTEEAFRNAAVKGEPPPEKLN